MNTTYHPTDEIIVHRFIRKIRKEMSWRKRSIGLASNESNCLDQFISKKSQFLSLLSFIDKSLYFINIFVLIRSKKQGQSVQHYLSSYPKMNLFMRKMKMAALSIAFGLKQVENDINSIIILHRTTNTYILSPHQKRTIDSLSDSEAYEWTRFTKPQLHTLLCLFKLPDRFVVHKTHYFDSEFVLILSLTYFSLAENFNSMKYRFGGNPDFWCCVVKELVQHLFEMFYHRISGDSLSFKTVVNCRMKIE